MKPRPKYKFKEFISKSLPLPHTNREPVIKRFKPGDKIFYFRPSGKLRVGIFERYEKFNWYQEEVIYAYFGDNYDSLSYSPTHTSQPVYLDTPENQYLKRRDTLA